MCAPTNKTNKKICEKNQKLFEEYTQSLEADDDDNDDEDDLSEVSFYFILKNNIIFFQ